jgi:hypothetical protein
VTTAEEMQCYGIIEKIIKGRHPNSPVAFRDAKAPSGNNGARSPVTGREIHRKTRRREEQADGENKPVSASRLRVFLWISLPGAADVVP